MGKCPCVLYIARDIFGFAVRIIYLMVSSPIFYLLEMTSTVVQTRHKSAKLVFSWLNIDVHSGI